MPSNIYLSDFMRLQLKLTLERNGRKDRFDCLAAEDTSIVKALTIYYVKALID